MLVRFATIIHLTIIVKKQLRIIYTPVTWIYPCSCVFS